MLEVSILPSTTKLAVGASGDPWTKRRFPVLLLLPPPHASQKVKSRNKAERRTARRKCSLQCNLNVYQKLVNSGNRMREKGQNDVRAAPDPIEVQLELGIGLTALSA